MTDSLKQGFHQLTTQAGESQGSLANISAGIMRLASDTMKPRTVFTLGYRQKTATMTLQQLVEWHVIIVDIRLKPYSRWARQYNKNAMIETYGERYIHIEELGNLHWNIPGSIKLKDADEGIAELIEVLKDGDVVLLCACREWDKGCHRTEVAKLLLEQQHDLRVIHIDEEHNVRSTWENGEVINRWTQEPLIIED